MAIRIPPLRIKILLESSLLKSRILVWRLAVAVEGDPIKYGLGVPRGSFGWFESLESRGSRCFTWPRVVRRDALGEGARSADVLANTPYYDNTDIIHVII